MQTPWTLTPFLDRAGEARHDPATVESWWSEPGTREVVVDGAGGFAVPLGRPTDGQLDPQRHVLLGRDTEGVVWFSSRGEVADPRSLRDAPDDPGLHEVATAAVAILAWHDAARHCERCGAPTTMATGGFHRTCTGCGRDVFPRHDPAMIVAVLDADDRLLLAHQASWAPGRVSVLAGFLESGESAEHAVAREVAEEVQVTISAARYVASQAWPFPRSLMLGFVARGQGEPVPDGVEIEWAHWYRRAEFTAAVADGSITHPPNNSIASRLIGLWLDGSLPDPDSNPLLA